MKHQKKAISFVLITALVFFPFVMTTGTSYGAETMGTTETSNAAFSDTDGHWAEKDIENAVKSGFVKGYEDGTFKPDKTVSRAEFVTMINKALQLRDENTVNLLFQDVRKTAWYYKDIQKASYAKYVNGVSDTSFMPNKNITREEAAEMLAGFLPKAGYQETTTFNAYSDAGQVSNWAKEAMAVVINKGYLTGYANGNLAPKGNLTRAEAAKTIGKILDKEPIVREDISVKNTGETLKDKIYVGDITIEKSVGEGEASLENLSALSKVYVEGGGINTVTINNSTVIQLIVCKEGTKVRVLSDGSTIYQAFVFNGNLLVDKQGQNARTGENGYENIIYLNGTVNTETAVKIAAEIAKKIDNTGKITKEQVSEGVGAVITASAITVNDDGSISIKVPATTEASINSTGSHKHHNGGGLTVNGLPATLTPITGAACSCGLPLTSEGAFTKVVEFDPDGIAGGETVTGYAIYTEAQLQHLAMHLNDNAVLMNDLDFSDIATGSAIPSTPMGSLRVASEAGIYTKGHAVSDFENGNFVPIGKSIYGSEYPYTGIFCGNGKSITGLIISCDADSVGIFGSASGAAIRNLMLKEGTITGNHIVGSIVGVSIGTIVDGICNKGQVNGKDVVGGVVGDNWGGTVSDSYNTGVVNSIEFGAGGIVGYNWGGTVSNSYNTGAVHSYREVGGITGINSSSIVINSFNTGVISGGNSIGGVIGENNGTLINGYNIGVVYGIGYHVGGVIGRNGDGATVSGSYNTGTIYGIVKVGGVAGYNCDNGIVSSSYNMGTITGESNVGGVVGDVESGVVNGCWMDESNLQNTGGIGYGSGDTATFSAIGSTMSAVYVSMSAITESAGGDSSGVVTSMECNGDSMNPTVFNTLQGAYILTGSSLNLTVNYIPGSTIAVTTGTAFGTLITPGGIDVTPQSSDSNTYTYSFSGLESGTWILVKAVNSENPKLNRIYTLYIKY